MGYKQTIEYAYDVVSHFYNLHENQILCIGKANLIILLPEEIFELFAFTTSESPEAQYIKTFKGIDVKKYSGSEILFVLKEIE